MEKETINLNEVIAKLKTRIFDLETKVNEIKDKIEIFYISIKNAIKILEKTYKE